METEQIIGIMFILLGVFLLFLSVYLFIKAFETYKWKNIKVKILNSYVDYHEPEHRRAKSLFTKYYVEVIYEYEINNKIYKGNKLHYNKTSSISKIYANTIKNRYPINVFKTGFYNPENLSEAVLVKGITLGDIIFVISSSVFIVVGIKLL